jgi:hypothetical protein
MSKGFVVLPTCSCHVSTGGLDNRYYGDDHSHLLNTLVSNKNFVAVDVIVTHSERYRRTVIAFRGNEEQGAVLALLPISLEIYPDDHGMIWVESSLNGGWYCFYDGRYFDCELLKRHGGVRCSVIQWKSSSRYPYAKFKKYSLRDGEEKVKLQARLLLIALFESGRTACLAIASPRDVRIVTVKGETGFRPEHLYLQPNRNFPKENLGMLVPCIYDTF